ncbi:Asp23/Gls24 family envelope stress response protein [Fructilactobacillus vespulae]|uniref:Asp23/Gls24 family envelope stress response protein n=1 Tax=Fructilactobacillus vespulae TaxID=1249630 RepID=UPI0039B37345
MAAEDQFITLSNKESDLGDIKVAPNVIEIIASIATTEVDGVNKMRGTFSSSVQGLFGRKERSHGIKLLFNDDDALDVDVYAYLDYGVSVPKVALQVQDQVKQQLLFMTDLHVDAVNVHVVGVVPEKEAKVDTDSLFDNDGEDSES